MWIVAPYEQDGSKEEAIMSTTEITIRDSYLLPVVRNVQLLYEQRELLKLLCDNGIPVLVLGDSSTAVFYPDPLRQELSDIDIFVQENWFQKACHICSSCGYTSFVLPEDSGAIAHFIRNGVTIHLQWQQRLFTDEKKNAQLNAWLNEQESINAQIEKFTFPVLQNWLNGVLQLALIQRDAERGGIVKKQIDDWAMFVNSFLSDTEWLPFKKRAESLGLVKTAMNISSLGKLSVSWCNENPDVLSQIRVKEESDAEARKEKKPPRIKRSLRLIYGRIKKSPLRKVFYYLNDFYFILSNKLQGKIETGLEDIAHVEKLVTFNYKSFNRQNQAKRLYYNIKSYYPKAKIIIADDSKKPLDLPGVIHLPFNSGLSKGLAVALEKVDTPYVMRLDDDMLLTPQTNIHKELKFLMEHPEVDLVAVMADHKKPREYAERFAKIRMEKKLKIPAGTVIDGRKVVYKTPNCFLARTEKLKLVGYDSNIRINEHHEFFSRAAGVIVCVLDPDSYIMHCHNLFERPDYEVYRKDTLAANQYVLNKHSSMYQ